MPATSTPPEDVRLAGVVTAVRAGAVAASDSKAPAIASTATTKLAANAPDSPPSAATLMPGILSPGASRQVKRAAMKAP